MQTCKVICVTLLCCIVANAHPSVVNNKAVNERPKLDWYENGVFYQIYPRSFKDSNGDGIGDIRGIIQELDYLKELGVDGAWLSPVFKSPMVDFGYDTEDFYDVDPMFGAMADLEELFSEAKKRNIKIIMDFVPNHSSDKCEWFKKSVKRDPEYEKFYIWADGKKNNTEPPNNWLSAFYGSAWTFNEERNQWYYHAFAKEQPDFNYRNENVTNKMIDVLNFWLEKGVNGFRLDAVNFFFESEDMRDEPLSNMTSDPKNYDYLKHDFIKNLGESFEIVYKFREAADKFQEKNDDVQLVLMSEAYVNDTDYVKYFCDGERKGTQIPFNFVLITDMDKDSTPKQVKKIIDKKIASVPAGTRLNWQLGNHDRPRIASLYGERRVDGLLTLILTLPGIAITYYGEELGMVDNRTIPYAETIDPQANTMDPTGNWMDFSRDPQRTPMQWDGTKKFAGFMPENATARPWLPINKNYKDVNVASERKNPHSTLNFYKQLVQLRKHDTFAYGSFTSTVINENVFAYVRELDNSDTYWVLINFGALEHRIDMTKSTIGGKVPAKLEIAAVGTDSCYERGATVRANEVVLRKYDTIILKIRPDHSN
ncbi:maltase 2-like [Contarinia nasturtii]|uniref:maltase 2-like n=1 Tax=Contarinia nasturtii TaxID=265458 RepID=UPI0012D38533|nr:maltase 2-like [Contarinia nasturtii]